MSDAPDTASSERSWGQHAARFSRDWLLPLLGFLLLFQLVGWWRAPALPHDAPGFALRDLDGATVDLADFRGQTVVLNFWATWCAPCRFEIPSFTKFASNNPDIPVLGVAADGSPAQLRKAAADLGIGYPVLVGDRDVLARYGVTTFPTTVVVGPDGEVVTAHTGVMTRPQLWWATR